MSQRHARRDMSCKSRCLIEHLAHAHCERGRTHALLDSPVDDALGAGRSPRTATSMPCPAGCAWPGRAELAERQGGAGGHVGQGQGYLAGGRALVKWHQFAAVGPLVAPMGT